LLLLFLLLLLLLIWMQLMFRRFVLFWIGYSR
jgi:hypothetical protein